MRQPHVARKVSKQDEPASGVRGLREEGLAIHREVVTTRRRVTEDHPVLFDADLASGLHNPAKMLHRAGENDEALLHITESVAIYRRLAMRLPAIYLRNVADTVQIQGEILFRLPGRLRAAASYALERAPRPPRSQAVPGGKQETVAGPENSDEEGPHRRDRPAPRTVRNQPKRTSRRRRKNTWFPCTRVMPVGSASSPKPASGNPSQARSNAWRRSW
jgi:hypothetical protein